MNQKDKLFCINLWRWTQGLPEWPIPGCTDFPKPTNKTLDDIVKHNKSRTRSNWLRSLSELSSIFEDKELNEQRDFGYLMGWFRYENPQSLDYKPNNGVNKEYCIKRIGEKLDMFIRDNNITYIVDVINLIELWFVGSDYTSIMEKNDVQLNNSEQILKHTIVRIINTLVDAYDCWDLYRWGVVSDWYLKWTDDGRPEKGIGA